MRCLQKKFESFLSAEVDMTEPERKKDMKSVRNRQAELSPLRQIKELSDSEKEDRLASFLKRHNLDQSFETFKK